MTTHAGGSRVKSGYYINRKSFAFANVEKDGGVLPGPSESRWLRVPVLAVMAAAPALGGLFVVVLPFIGFGLTAYAVARAIGGKARKGAREVAATVAAPGPLPGESYLTGRPAEKNEAGAPAPGTTTDELARTIEEKRSAK